MKFTCYYTIFIDTSQILFVFQKNFGKSFKMETFALCYNTISPEKYSPGISICLRCAVFVQLIGLAEDQIADDEEDDQAAHRQILVLEGNAEDVYFHACGDLADVGLVI